MNSLFETSSIQNPLNDASNAFMNINFKNIITDTSIYTNVNLDDSFSNGSIFLNNSNLNDKILKDNTLINNIYKKIYNNNPLPTYQGGNYPVYNTDGVITPTNFNNNWGCFTIPILSNTGNFDTYRVISVFNPWFILSNDQCITQNLPQITPGTALASGSNSGSIFQNWLFNAGNLNNCNSVFNLNGIIPVNLKIAFSDENTKLNLSIPDMYSVQDSNGKYYCIAAFQPISSTRTLYSTFVLDAQYSNKSYTDDTAVNSCLDNSYVNVIYQDVGIATTQPSCVSFLNKNGTCPYTSLDIDMLFNITLPNFNGINTTQDCFNFIKPDQFTNYFGRGILYQNVCSFQDWTSAGNQSYYTLEQYLKKYGNIDIPNMLSNLSNGNLIYADNNGGNPILTNLSKNNVITINHNAQVDWRNLNSMSANSSQNIGNIDKRVIRVGCNPKEYNTCKDDTPTGGSTNILPNDQLYAKGNGETYYSLSSVEQNIQNAWQLGASKLNGLNYNGNQINFGDSPFSETGTGNRLYSLINDPIGLFNADGTINNNEMFITDNTPFPASNQSEDWTQQGTGAYQKITSQRNTPSNSDPYYFNVAEKWGNPDNKPFQAESKFSNYYNQSNLNFCSQVDITADSPIYSPDSLFSQSSLTEYGNTSFVTNGTTLWKCSCPPQDTTSSTGYCIPPSKYWWYKTEILDTTSNSAYWNQTSSLYYNQMNDNVSQKYNRIIYLLGPQSTQPDPTWLQVKKGGVGLETPKLSEAVSVLSAGGNGNYPSDTSQFGDKGIKCPSPSPDTGSSLYNSFSNQLTAKNGSTDPNNILTYQTLNNYASQYGQGVIEPGDINLNTTNQTKFLLGTGANNYNSPGNTIIQTENVYTCSNHIINSASGRTSGFPGGFYYEDVYNYGGGCPGGYNVCGAGQYAINNESQGGKAFPYWNQQSLPVGMQQITVVIYDNGYFYRPDSIQYQDTFGNTQNLTPTGSNQLIINNITGVISEPTNICDPKQFQSGLGPGYNVPGWATGKMGSNADVTQDGYIPSCFLVGSPIAEAASNTDSRGWIPTTSADTASFNAEESVITITSSHLNTGSVKIKNDLSILRSDNDVNDNNQVGACFKSGTSPLPRLPGDLPLQFRSKFVDPSTNMGNGASAFNGWNSQKMYGVKSPCYNTGYNDGVIRINLSNYANSSANNVYLVISTDPNFNINDGIYTLISTN